MHHVSIYLHDQRVSGNTPRCDLAILTNASHNLGARLREVADSIDKRFPRLPASFITLHILCHGGPRGLELASGASQHNVQLFLALRGKVGRIEVHGCSAAHDYTQQTPRAYNGQEFGSMLAQLTLATVLAADATQFYNNSNSITSFSNNNQMIRWQGTVTRWDRDGQSTQISQEARESGFRP